MKQLRRTFVLLAAFLVCSSVAYPATFLDRLDPGMKRELGLDRLSPEQLEKLGRAIENYRHEEAATAATTAVEEYRKQEEPGVVSRALDVFKSEQKLELQERIMAAIPGPFSGWDGKTLFTLDNGQVWRQSRADTYITKPQTNVAVVIYKSPNGYWRLRLLDDVGAWVTVVRVK